MRLNPQPLIEARAIERRVTELADSIAHDYLGRVPILLGVLKGALHLTSDLARRMPSPVGIEFVRASSYSGTESTGHVEISGDHLGRLSQRDVIVVEDILDTGRTCSALMAHLRTYEPSSLRLCTLLDKPCRRVVPVTADYVGFSIDDHFVVGYGLDHDEEYRSLPAIHVLEP